MDIYKVEFNSLNSIFVKATSYTEVEEYMQKKYNNSEGCNSFILHSIEILGALDNE